MNFPELFPDGNATRPVISFFVEDVDFQVTNQEKIRHWIIETIQAEGKSLVNLQIICCSDAYLHQINLNYLNHDTLTDIITFPFNDHPDKIEGEIYLSIERIRENAVIFDTLFKHEFLRVVIHGILHLCGYKDKSTEEQKIMREKENFFLKNLVNF